MSANREAFASAERLAYYARDTFKATPLTVLEVLVGWRDRHEVALSDGALALVTSHVCEFERLVSGGNTRRHRARSPRASNGASMMLSDRVITLASRAEALRGVLSTMPAIIPIRAPFAPPETSRSVHLLPENPAADVLTIDDTFSGRLMVITIEPLASGSWCLGLRDFDRTELRSGRAKRTLLVPLRHLPDLADALIEAMTRTVDLYSAAAPDTTP